MRIKEQGTRLALQEHNDDDKKDWEILTARSFVVGIRCEHYYGDVMVHSGMTGHVVRKER